jgi:CrcB protein
MTALAAILAGGAGAAGRYLVAGIVQRSARGRFPIGTLTVNLVGSLLVGIVFGATQSDSVWRALPAGFCAGFTTFSTWSTESLTMIRSGRSARAALNLAGTLVIGVGLCALGYTLAH